MADRNKKICASNPRCKTERGTKETDFRMYVTRKDWTWPINGCFGSCFFLVHFKFPFCHFFLGRGRGGRTVSNTWLDAKVTSLTCCFLAGVLCPAAAGSCAGWFWGEAASAALAFPFSASFFSWGCLASVSVPDSVVMVNHAEEGKEQGGEGETLGESSDQLWTCYPVRSSDAKIRTSTLTNSNINSQICGSALNVKRWKILLLVVPQI